MPETDIHEQMADALLNIDKSDFNPGQDLLDQGKWITYRSLDYPGFLIKEYPDGTKELLDEKDGETIIKTIKP